MGSVNNIRCFFNMLDFKDCGRSRTPNFSMVEKNLLLVVVGNYKHIIENKKTAKIKTQNKNDCWENIQLDFNAQSVYRNSHQLMSLYEQLKKMAKKEKSANKIETFLTGEDSKKSGISDLANKTIQIMEPLTVTPLINRFDSSAPYNGETLQEDDSPRNNDISQLEQYEVEYLDATDSLGSTSNELQNEAQNVQNSQSHTQRKRSSPLPNQRKRSSIRGVYDEVVLHLQ